MPSMTIEATGFGAGSRELDDLPNLTQVVVGTISTTPRSTAGQPVVAARGQRRRRHRRDPGPHDRGAARGGGPRRVAHADRHEEGAARLHGERAGRSGAGGSGGGAADGGDGVARGARIAARAVAGAAFDGRGGGRRAPDPGEGVARAAPRPSTTTSPGSPASPGCPLREVRFEAERAWRDSTGPDDEPA